MESFLVLAERRLRTVLKLLLIGCFPGPVLHIFPKWTPGFLEGLRLPWLYDHREQTFPQRGLIALLLALVTGRYPPLWHPAPVADRLSHHLVIWSLAGW